MVAVGFFVCLFLCLFGETEEKCTFEIKKEKNPWKCKAWNKMYKQTPKYEAWFIDTLLTLRGYSHVSVIILGNGLH